jgi:hypothetical protein
MAVQSSYPIVAEQIVNYNKNVVDLLSKINSLVTTSDPSVTVNIVDQSGITRQFNLPSVGYLKSEIERLNNNINSIYSINEAGALIQPANGTKFRKVVTVDLNKEPNDVGDLNLVTTFRTAKNWFFDSLLNPQIFVELNLTNQVEDNVRKILCRRYIPEFAKDSSGNFTPLGQSALNSFNNLFRNRNGFTYDEYIQWHENTPGLVEPVNPNYDEQMFDLEPNMLEYDGSFTVLKIEEDTLNKKLFYHVDTLVYVRNLRVNGVMTQERRQLAVGDEMIINTPASYTRYKILEISTTAVNPRLRFERVEGNEPVPVGIATLKIYSPVIYNKNVLVSVGYDERNVIFVKPLNMDNYILAKNWSRGLGYWTNDLIDTDTGTSLEQYYVDSVYDYGMVFKDLVAKKTPNKLAGTPNSPNLVSSNFKVVQINRHLTDTADSNLLKTKHNQQKNLKSEVQQLLDAVQEKNKQIKITRFTSDASRKQFNNEIDQLNKTKESKSKLLSTVTSEILSLSNSPNTKVKPVFRVRGFWSMPEAVITRGTRPQEVVQFRVQYRYLSKDGKESPVETFKLNDATTGSKSGAFSNWIEMKTDARKRVYDSATGNYFWQIEDVSNADTPNINQVDIEIQYNEKVEIRIKSISEVGYPESPVESEFSNTISVDFPDDLNNVLNENDFILKEASKEDLRVSVQSDLSARGLDEHLSEQVTINNVTYHHSSDKILSGFKDANGTSIDLFEYLSNLESRIKTLEDKIRKVKGELEISVIRNSENFIIKNGSELTFNVECEDYLEPYQAPGVASGRVYANNIYVVKDFLLKVRNKSIDNTLGLLSNRSYSSTTSNAVYSSSSPQVFWVDQQNQILLSNITGISKTQLDNQFIWSVNYDSLNQSTVIKLAQSVGNEFAKQGNNSITNALSSNEYNIGFSGVSVLSFIGNNTSLLDRSKWVDPTTTVSSTTRLLTSVHPQIPSLEKIQETNTDRVYYLEGGAENDINVPINIYFKMNALDNNQPGLNYEYVNLNGIKTSVKHTKKIKFLLENEDDNKPFIFTLTFNINRAKLIVKKTIESTPTATISNR